MIATESFVEQNLGSTLGKKYGFTKYCNDGCCYKLLMLNIPTLIQDLASRSFDKTTTGVPNFPAYVSGHSTFSCCKPSAISYPSKKTYEAMAIEASNSTVWSDSLSQIVNKGLRVKVARFAIDRAALDGAEK
jgi:hypothetical protein